MCVLSMVFVPSQKHVLLAQHDPVMSTPELCSIQFSRTRHWTTQNGDFEQYKTNTWMKTPWVKREKICGLLDCWARTHGLFCLWPPDVPWPNMNMCVKCLGPLADSCQVVRSGTHTFQVEYNVDLRHPVLKFQDVHPHQYPSSSFIISSIHHF